MILIDKQPRVLEGIYKKKSFALQRKHMKQQKQNRAIIPSIMYFEV